MPHPVVHFEIIAKDPQGLARFYREAFAWEIPSAPVSGGSGVSEYYMVLPEGGQDSKVGINGGIGSLPPGYGGHVTFYVSVDDVEAALQKVERLGGKRMMGPDHVPNGPVIGLFVDPQGHTIGLVKLPAPSA